MAVRLTAFRFAIFPLYPRHYPNSLPISSLCRSHRIQNPNLTLVFPRCRRFLAARAVPQEQELVEEAEALTGEKESEWGRVSAVLFDMDGVLCNSEELSRMAAVDVFAEMGVSVATDDFVPFMGTGNFPELLNS